MRRRLPDVRRNDNPLTPLISGLDNLHNEIDRWFDELARGLPGLESLRAGHPKVEVFETDENVFVNAELPGVESKDVDVRVFPHEVRIKAERRQEQEFKEDRFYRSERYYGSISRNIPLPEEIDSDRATASFKNGILKLTLPKVTPTDSGRRLSIED